MNRVGESLDPAGCGRHLYYIMKKIICIVFSAMMVLMPSVAKDKAPKSEKVNNIILLIGDGMGLGVAGAWMVDRNYEPTCFDRAQFVGLSKTYSLNSRVTDSAASGTAMATGHFLSSRCHTGSFLCPHIKSRQSAPGRRGPYRLPARCHSRRRKMQFHRSEMGGRNNA